jgi:hypothetical protein
MECRGKVDMRLWRVYSIALLAGAVAMLVLALCLWQDAELAALKWNASRPAVLAWSIRSAAIGLGTGAQVLALSVLVHGVYRRDLISDILRFAGLLLVMIAGVSAIALGLAGR